MGYTVFYSWQKDLPNAVNRGFIGEALRQAAKLINADPEVEERVDVDQDTKGVPGSPPIFDTILEKISNCTVFVPDVSFVAVSKGGRPTPNPNVLIEYGFAVRAIGDARVVPVFNTAFGRIEELPFDIRHKKIPGIYSLSENCTQEERRVANRSLVNQLRSALTDVIALAPAAAKVPNIVVRAIPMTMLEEGPRGGRRVDHFLEVRVENHSTGPLFLSSVALEMDDGKSLFTSRDQDGALNSERRIEPGDSASMRFDMLAMLRAADPRRIVGAVANDKIGRVYKTQPEEFEAAITHAVIEFHQTKIGQANAKAAQDALEELIQEGKKPGR